MSKDSPRERLDLLNKHLEDRQIDLALISDPKHIFYFAGLLTFKFRFTSFLLVNARNGKSTIFLGKSEEEKARKVFNGEIETFEDYNLNQRMIAYPNFVSEEFDKKLGSVIKESVRNGNEKRVGIEFWHLPRQYVLAIERQFGRDAALDNLSEYVLSLRKTKGSDEIKDHQASTARLDFAYKVAKENTMIGRTENEVYREVNYSVTKEFGPFSFAEMHNIIGDYVSGPRTLEMGGPPTGRKLRRGDAVILDLQACVHGHWSDLARTFIVKKKANEKQKKLFNAIVHAKKKAEELLKPGTVCADIYRSISKEIRNAGYSDFLPHHAGHGLGLEDQEPPFFLPFSQDRLEPGVVCALEPGIYSKEASGMRFEDNYIVTEDGYEKLSKYPITLS